MSGYHDSRLAARELHRHQLANGAGRPEWLESPDLVPESATAYVVPEPKNLNERFYNVSAWMINSLTEWVVATHSQLDISGVFKKHSLDMEDRVHVLNRFKHDGKVRASYVPGFQAMAQIFSVIPEVATRDSGSDADYGEIASRARLFGESIARDGSMVQIVARKYLINSKTYLDSSKLKLDEETGITTVTPIEQIVHEAREASKHEFPPEDGVCVAMQAKINGPSSPTVFEASWDALTDFGQRLIYPNIAEQELAKVPKQAAPDPNLAKTIQSIYATERRRYI